MLNWPSVCNIWNCLRYVVYMSVLYYNYYRSLFSLNMQGKQLLTTIAENCICNPPGMDISAVAPCDHEEADTRMFLHASAAVSAGHKRIMIRSTDSDVIVLGIAAVCFLKQHGLQELWVSFGTGNRSRFVTHLKSNTSNDAYNHLHSTGAFHCREPRG